MKPAAQKTDTAGASPPPARRVLRLVVQAMAALLVTVLVAIVTSPAQAQVRPIPESARLGKLTLGVFPQAELDGKAVTLGPGTRIYDRENRVVIPSTLKGETRVVAYVTGSLGEVVSVWILSDAELQRLRARPKQ